MCYFKINLFHSDVYFRESVTLLKFDFFCIYWAIWHMVLSPPPTPNPLVEYKSSVRLSKLSKTFFYFQLTEYCTDCLV